MMSSHKQYKTLGNTFNTVIINSFKYSNNRSSPDILQGFFHLPLGEIQSSRFTDCTRTLLYNTMEASTPKEEPVQIVYDFKCTSCGLDEKAHYKGTNPPFSRNIVLRCPSYVMKDPFSPQGKGEILVLGSDCTICGQTVCISKECSLFYQKIYCLDCANKLIETFPVEIKTKLVQINKK